MKAYSTNRLLVYLILVFTFLVFCFSVQGCTTGTNVSLFRQLTDECSNGRMVGTEGNLIACRVLAAQMKYLKLAPFDESDDYFIPYEQGLITYDDDISMSIIMTDGSTDMLVQGNDYQIGYFVGAIDGVFDISYVNDTALQKDSIYVFDPKSSDTAISDLYDKYAAILLVIDEIKSASQGYNIDGTTLQPNNTPIIKITPSTYERLGSAQSVELHTLVNHTTTTANNIVGVIPGKNRDKAIVLTAHFDGVGEPSDITGNEANMVFPGALDNASGVATMMIAAEILTDAQPETDIVICALNGEEAGLCGAYAIVPALKERYEQLYNINIDCVGMPDIVYAVGNENDCSSSLTRALSEYLRGKDAAVDEERLGSGDHYVFHRYDIPAVVLQDTLVGNNHLHTPLDTPDQVDEAELKKLAVWIADFIRSNPAEMFEHIHTQFTEEDEDVPILGLDEMLVKKNRMYGGHASQISRDELLAYFLNIPVPDKFMGCSFLYANVSMMPTKEVFTTENTLISIPLTPSNITSISIAYTREDDHPEFHHIMIAPPNFGIKGAGLIREELSVTPERYAYIENNTDQISEVIERHENRSYCFSGSSIQSIAAAETYIESAEVQSFIETMNEWFSK